MELAAMANDRPVVDTAQQIVTTLTSAASLSQDDPVAAYLATAQRPILGFDIDNTIGHTMEALITILNAYDGVPRNYWGMRTVDIATMWPDRLAVIQEFLSTPAVYASIVPYVDTLDFASACARAGYTIMIATKRAPESEQVSREWLERIGFPTPAQLFIGARSKIDICTASRGTSLLMFDDDPRNAAVMRAFPNVSVMMPERPYNRGQVGTFQRWSDVLASLGVTQPVFSLEALPL
jgi:5'(3')-deoxyribonucleotidase